LDLVDLGVALEGTAFDLVADLGVVALVTGLDFIDFGVAVALPVPLLLRFTPVLALAGEACGAAAGVSSFVGMLLLLLWFYIH
jgi:hypothetical protein